MTDPGLADATYIEPITPEVVARIIEKERPDALLPTMGGQTGLNTSLALEELGVLAKYGVEMIGAKARKPSRWPRTASCSARRWTGSGFRTPRPPSCRHPSCRPENTTSRRALQQAIDAIELRRPAPRFIRPAFTLGGTGGGVAYNREDYEYYCRTGMEASPVAQILVDESLLGWKEFEMEVVRDPRRTTPSSSAPSRTSTRWACTRATAFTRRPRADVDRQGVSDYAQRLHRRAARDRGWGNRRIERLQMGREPEDGAWS